MASKFYAVKKGKIPGIYNSWDDCKKMVDGFPGAVYKSFKTLEEAEAFVGAEGSSRKRSEKAEKPDTGKQEQNPAVYAFVDGSYNIATKVYGYGGFLIHNGEKEVLQGSGNDAEMASMRNVSGEILGAMAAVERAIELKLPEVTIYYDYMIYFIKLDIHPQSIRAVFSETVFNLMENLCRAACRIVFFWNIIAN